MIPTVDGLLVAKSTSEAGEALILAKESKPANTGTVFIESAQVPLILSRVALARSWQIPFELRIIAK